MATRRRTTQTADPPDTPDPKTYDGPAANVIEALCRVMAEMPTIGKDSEMSEGPKYKYRGIEQITPHTQQLFARHGVILAPHRIVRWDLRDLTLGGKPWTDDRLVVHYRVYGPGGPGDYIDLEVPGIGRDNSDKGSNKAMTAAMKYALAQTLQIAGDDPDAYHPTADGGAAQDPGPDLDEPIFASWAEDITNRLHGRGLSDDQIAALVWGATQGRTDQVTGIRHSEWKRFLDLGRQAVESRPANDPPDGPGSPQTAQETVPGLVVPEPVDSADVGPQGV